MGERLKSMEPARALPAQKNYTISRWISKKKRELREAVELTLYMVRKSDRQVTENHLPGSLQSFLRARYSPRALVAPVTSTRCGASTLAAGT